MSSVVLEALQKDIFYRVNQLLDDDYTHTTHKQLNELTEEITHVMSVLADLKRSCITAQKRITADLTICDAQQQQQAGHTDDVQTGDGNTDGPIQHTANGMIMYPGRKLAPLYKTVLTPAGLPLTALQVDQMQNIPSALYYYTGAEYPRGFYMRVGVAVVQVPWAPIYHASPYPPCARCKYQTKALCDMQRNKASIMYKVPQKKCYYAHQGDQLPRIVHQSRCPTLPNFGTVNPVMFQQTQNTNHTVKLTNNDIKSLLFHGISDVACAALAIESKKQNIVLIDIDKA
jgi:hypothetical protein